MKSVLISIQPKWCELIASGVKTVEVRKTRPKLESPFKVYIYQTKAQKRLIDVIKDGDEIYGEIYHGKTQFIKTDNDDCHLAIHPIYRQYGKVIGEFVCDCIGDYWFTKDDKDVEEYEDVQRSCLSAKEIIDYGDNKDLYFWHISNLVIYDKPRELSEFETKKTVTTLTTEHNIEGTVGYPKKEVVFDKLTKPPQSWCYVGE